jgi:predicted transposase YbfD/YdcC
LETEVEDYFRTAPTDELVTKTTVEKGHGCIETRIYAASRNIGWIKADKRYRGEPRFKHVNTLVRVLNRTGVRRPMYHRHAALNLLLSTLNGSPTARGHGGVESMHWLLDVAFKDDLSRYRSDHGAKTWPSFAASRLASFAPTKPKKASKQEEKQQVGIQTSSSMSFK